VFPTPASSKLPQVDPFGARNVRRGMAHFLTGRAIQGLLSFAVMVLLARYMPVVEYAYYVTATGAATLLGSLSKFGLDRVITRYLPEGRTLGAVADLRAFLRIVRGLRLLAVAVLALALVALWSWLAPLMNLLPNPGMLLAVAGFALSHAFTAFQRINLQSLMLQRGLRQATTVLWTLRLAGVGVLAIAAGGIDVKQALWIATLSECVGLVWMARVERDLMRQLASQPPRGAVAAVWPSNWLAVRRFALQNYASQLAGLPSQGPALRVIGAVFLPPHMLAAYGFFQALAENLRAYLPLQLMRTLFEPVALGRYAQDRDFAKLNAMVSTLYKLNLLVLLPFGAWFLVGGEGAVRALTGGKYAEDSWILAASVLPIALASHWALLVILANAVGASNRLVWGSLAGSLMVPVVLMAALPSWGVASLILAAGAAAALANLVVMDGIRRQGFAYGVDWRRIAQMAAFACLAGLVSWGGVTWSDQRHTLAGTVISALLTTGVFFLAHLKWKAFSDIERDLLGKLSGRFTIPF